jgi:methylglutaconyl-CoA hydratase
VIQFSSLDGIAHITLDRPEKRNALNPQMITELRSAFNRAQNDGSVRVIVLRGAGKDFCAGLDLQALTESDEVLDHLGTARALAELYLSMRRHPKPIIAAVHGRAIGGGCGLATASDIVLATDTAEFRYPEVNLGFIAAIVMAMLRRLVGEKRAFEIIALGEPISAASALELGLVNHLYESSFEENVNRFAATLAAKSASAVSLTKDLFYHIDGMTFEAAMHAGLYGNALARMTPDARAGFQKFLTPAK